MRDEPTIELVTRARRGDMPAMEALLQRCLPPLKRWAHGRLPAAARGRLDTGDSGARGGAARDRQSRHVRAASCGGDASLSSPVGRQPDLRRGAADLPSAAASRGADDHPSDRTSPEEDAIRAEEYDHYREAVLRLTPKDRALIVARIEMQWSLAEIAHRYRLRSVDAARMAVNRAVKRLSADFAARRK